MHGPFTDINNIMTNPDAQDLKRPRSTLKLSAAQPMYQEESRGANDAAPSHRHRSQRKSPKGPRNRAASDTIKYPYLNDSADSDLSSIRTVDLADLASIWSTESETPSSAPSSSGASTSVYSRSSLSIVVPDRPNSPPHADLDSAHSRDSLEFDPETLAVLDVQLLESPQDAFAAMCWTAATGAERDAEDMLQHRRSRIHACRPESVNLEHQHSRSEGDLLGMMGLGAPEPIDEAEEDEEDDVRFAQMPSRHDYDPDTPSLHASAYTHKQLPNPNAFVSFVALDAPAFPTSRADDAVHFFPQPIRHARTKSAGGLRQFVAGLPARLNLRAGARTP